MVLTVKKYLKYILYKKYDHSILNKFKYILSVQKIVTTLFPAAARCTYTSPRGACGPKVERMRLGEREAAVLGISEAECRGCILESAALLDEAVHWIRMKGVRTRMRVLLKIA
jgi:hypothetical protein